MPETLIPRTTVAGPAGQRGASAEDFDAGAGQAAAARGTVSRASRTVAAAGQAESDLNRRVAVSQASQLQELGQAITTLGVHAEEARRAAAVTAAKAAAAREIQEYDFELENGGTGPDGPTPAAHPDWRAGLHDSKVVEIKKRVRKELGDTEFASFAGDFDQLALRQGLELRGRALAAQKQARKVQLDDTLDNLADFAANGDHVTRPLAMERAKLAIGEAERAGSIDPLEAGRSRDRFAKRVALTGVRRSMNEERLGQAPPGTTRKLLSGDTLPGLSPEEQQQHLSHAIQIEDSLRADKLAQEAREQRLADKAEKDQDDEAHKQLADKGKAVTLADVQALRGSLSAERYKTWVGIATHGDPDTTDPLTFSELRKEAAAVRTPADFARFQKNADTALGKRLRTADYSSLMSVAEGNVGDKDEQPWMSEGRQIIFGFTGGERSFNPFVQQVQTRAITEWNRWARENRANPKVTHEDAIAKAQELAERSSLLKNVTLGMVEPKFLKGSRGAPDLAKTFDETEKALKDGRISEPEYRREMVLLQQWKDALIAGSEKLAGPAAGGAAGGRNE